MSSTPMSETGDGKASSYFESFLLSRSDVMLLILNISVLFQLLQQRHLLPFQVGQGDYGPDGPGLPGRPRPHYTYSRKSNLKKNKGPQAGLDFTDNEDDDSNLQAVSFQ